MDTNLQPFPPVGNDFRNPWPQAQPGTSRVAGAGVYPGARSASWPTSPSPETTGQTLDPTRFQMLQSTGFNRLNGSTFLLLDEPPNKRVYLEIRVSPLATGSIAVGINQIPADASQCSWLIGPGETKVFEYVIPQNRLFARVIGGDTVGVLTFANFNLGP